MGGRRRGETVGLVLAPAALIGRSGACALALGDDDEVSAQHARLVAQGHLVILADLGSTNGTLLNGVPLTAPSPVRDGDVVRLGQTELRVSGVGRW
jgi:pSer/pThr/pTyr-binding forkhead associated (FHA) protein